MIGQFHLLFIMLIVAILGGCATFPPGSDYPRTASSTLAHPEETRLGRQFVNAASAHDGNSGFRIIPVGADGFLTRMQMINAAERTLDLQYYIFRGDETGRQLTGAVLHAADRGLRVRVLVDDGETVAGDEQIAMLEAHTSIEIRIINPFAYRGHSSLFRATEFMFNTSRLDYRMHNKLLVVDNAIALVGGRNIGDQYFQIDPDSQFADDDLFVAGPVAQQLSATFDEFWNNALSIPVEALSGGKPSHADLREHREELGEERLSFPKMRTA
jgi:putative cardiolipin synthase